MKLNHRQKDLINKLVSGKYSRFIYAYQQIKAIKIDELELIYVPIPKAASRSIKTALAEKTNKPFTISSHRADWDYMSISKVSRSPYYSFSIVRNPLDRLLSCYIQKSRMRNFKNLFWKYGNLLSADMSFEAFAEFVCETPDHLADRHFKSQHAFLEKNKSIIVNQVGKMENLEEEWQILSQKYNLPLLNHLNQSNSQRFKQYYTKQLAEKVCERYTRDIELFGYKELIEKRLAEL